MSSQPFNPATFTLTSQLRSSVSRSFDLCLTTATRLIRRLALIKQIRAERRQLKSLPAETLRDIGIDRSAADVESKRGLLDLPANRVT